MQLSRAAENYLATIYAIQIDKEKVRSIDIVKALNYSRPTISIAMRNLREHKVITMDARGVISMTAKGKKIAQNIYKRRTALRDVLIQKGVSAKTAAQDAAKIEYDLSEESYQAIVSALA